MSGSNHARLRPKFYEHLGLWRGTINIQLASDIDESVLIPNQRVLGRDPFDFSENQDFLIRLCRLKETPGYQILPIDKTTSVPRGLHRSKQIEIALKEKIELELGEELEVELQGFED